MENKIENKENEKFVVKVYRVYPAWGPMEQLVGAVVCDSEDEANKVAYEIMGINTNAIVRKMSGNIEEELWKEWAKDVEKFIVNLYYDVYGLNIISSEEYREEGFEFVQPDWSDAVFSEGGEFLGWYDFEKDAVVDAEGRIVGKYDENGNFVRAESDNV